MFERIKNFFKTNEVVEKEATHNRSGYQTGYFSEYFNGEKNLGEIGAIKNYYLDYNSLRLRSWQSYLESEITQTVINRYAKWVVGSGLKLKSEPNIKYLENNEASIDVIKFTSNVESSFQLYAKSKLCDYSGMDSLNEIAKKAFINSKVGGDILVVLRVVNGFLKIQLIDGAHVCDEYNSSEHNPQYLKNGNKVIHGIEMSKTGEHVAYYIHKGNNEYERIKRKNKLGIVQSFLVGSGLRMRINNYRDIPSISAILETLKKLERYKEATVGSAEEQNKIPYTIEHGTASTGENPLQGQMAKAFNIGNSDQVAEDIDGDQLADNIAATTNKQVFNMPIDSSLKSLDAKMQLYFRDFYTLNEDVTYYTIGMPPDVARSKYDSNFSASRAALKDWEHTLLVERSQYFEYFYEKIYRYWFNLNILQNNIQAPKYSLSNESLVNEAYLSSRFIGVGVPHIDPEKEVRAERLKLGETGARIPLTTVEKSTEQLNAGDSEQNIIQYSKELEDFNELTPDQAIDQNLDKSES